jgi:hypothetical protein
VTWTLKYPACHWLQINGLERHYHRAELSARMVEDRLEIAEPKNITRFAVLINQLAKPPAAIQIGTKKLPLAESLKSKEAVQLERGKDGWQLAGEFQPERLTGKQPGLQGPIDDAFTGTFLCVRGTGTPWNPAVQAYAEASLNRFAAEWRQYFRGELPIKKDTEVTADDIQACNLILFGDPGSNKWIANLQAHFPISWKKDLVKFGGNEYPAANHVPAWIMPNPLPGGKDNYVVINSGHTFRGADLGKINYLLFPRWGDWAVLKIDPDRKATEPITEEVLKAGFFDEDWKLPK